MNKATFEERRNTRYEILGSGIDTTTYAEKVWRDKVTKQPVITIPAGTRVHIDFSPKKWSGSMFVHFGDTVIIASISTANKWIKAISKPPTINTLEKRQWNGISKSVTGHKVEPDGYGPDGSPSWELVVGII